MATLDLTLGEEAETFRWLQTEVQSSGSVPLLEAEAVVRSLSVAMHGDSRMVLPLLKLKEFDQYTTTHSLNVAVLSMGLAESLGCRPREIRAIGVAGLLHDIGKIRIPLEVLTKPGKLTDEERAIMNSHPIDGARVIMQSEEDLGMAATVAYEHHIMLNGGGYPAMHYKRECAMASRLVHVCDVYDALSTKRPYRDAWPAEKTMAYLEERAGTRVRSRSRGRVHPDAATGSGTGARAERRAHSRACSARDVLAPPRSVPCDRRHTRHRARRRCRRRHRARSSRSSAESLPASATSRPSIVGGADPRRAALAGDISRTKTRALLVGGVEQHSGRACARGRIDHRNRIRGSRHDRRRRTRRR